MQAEGLAAQENPVLPPWLAALWGFARRHQPLIGTTGGFRIAAPGALGRELGNVVDYLGWRAPEVLNIFGRFPIRLGAKPMKELSEATYTQGALDEPWKIVLNPKLLEPESRDIAALSLFHELSHPGVQKMPIRRLEDLASRALGSLPRPHLQKVLSGYKGRDLIEELAVRGIEQELARQRFGLPWLPYARVRS